MTAERQELLDRCALALHYLERAGRLQNIAGMIFPIGPDGKYCPADACTKPVCLVSEMAEVVTCLNGLGFKLRRQDAGGKPTWALET